MPVKTTKRTRTTETIFIKEPLSDGNTLTITLDVINGNPNKILFSIQDSAHYLYPSTSSTLTKEDMETISQAILEFLYEIKDQPFNLIPVPIPVKDSK